MITNGNEITEYVLKQNDREIDPICGENGTGGQGEDIPSQFFPS